MKNTIFLLSIILLSSCSRYYAYHANGLGNISNTQDECVYENDTIKIVYDFWQDGGKMSFYLYNKLSIPLFIDWKNSALIINSNKFAYWQDKEIKQGSSTRVAYHGISTGSESSTTVKDERVSSIPPHSKIKKIAPDRLRSNPRPKIDGFEMNFRNFLAVSTYEDVKADAYIDNEFKVVNIEESRQMPHKNKKDFFTRIGSF